MKKSLFLLTLCAVSSGVAAPHAAAFEPAEGTGPVQITGSSTLAPFARAVAETLEQRHGTPFILHQTGTSGGIAVFCKGISDIDIVNASRPIRQQEVDLCMETGVGPLLEFPAGKDGIVLAQAKRQRDLPLALKDLYYALAAETPAADDDCRMEPNRRATWREVNARLPGRQIEIFGPPDTSGTRDSFFELALLRGALQVPCIAAQYERDGLERLEASIRLREDGVWVDAGENDDAMAAALGHIETALGVVGYSQVRRGQHGIEAVTLEGVQASDASIADGSYPLSRQMWFYVSAERYEASGYLQDYAAEFSRREAIGSDGYLSDLGLVQAAGEDQSGRRLSVLKQSQ